jgi:hypothetical protein
LKVDPNAKCGLETATKTGMVSIHHFKINYFFQIVLLGEVSVDRSKVDFE